MKKNILGFSIFFLLCLGAYGAPDQEPKNPCSDDIARFCSGLTLKETKDCLANHTKSLSPACQNLRNWNNHMHGHPAPCKDDQLKFCKDVPENQVFQCFDTHHDDLSQLCKKWIDKSEGVWVKFKTTCQDDLGKTCPGLAFGSTEARRCLEGHESALAPACVDAMNHALYPKK